MSRNTKIRKHSYIPSGKKGPSRTHPNYNRYANTAPKQDTLTRNQKAAMSLNGLLLLIPWTILFSFGAIT